MKTTVYLKQYLNVPQGYVDGLVQLADNFEVVTIVYPAKHQIVVFPSQIERMKYLEQKYYEKTIEVLKEDKSLDRSSIIMDDGSWEETNIDLSYTVIL